jgi:hypothetical protein
LKILLDNEYKNGRQPIGAECLTCGNNFQTDASRLVKDMGCQLCGWKRGGRKNAANHDEIKEELLKKNIELLSKYENYSSTIKVRYIDCGHEDYSNWAALKKGRACGICQEANKPTEVDFQKFADRYGGTLVKLANNFSKKAKWKCKYGHIFWRSLIEIKRRNSFCTICTQGWGEGACRTVLEYVFGKPFPKVRLKDMQSEKGKPLEFDCYNEKLKIALEHQGMHHYKSQKNWGGESALLSRKINDSRKHAFAKKNKISLIIIPEVGSITSLENVPTKIEKELLNQGRDVPKLLKTLDIHSLEIKSARDFYIKEVSDAASLSGFSILDPIGLADVGVRVLCQNGHETLKTPRSIKYGFKCKQCRKEKISKPVKLSDGRTFKSRKEAGDALGVNKTTINKAVLKKKKVKGVFVYDI